MIYRCHWMIIGISLLVFGVSLPGHAKVKSPNRASHKQLGEIGLNLRTCQRAVVTHRRRQDVVHQNQLQVGVTLSDKLGRSEFKLALDQDVLANIGFDRFFPDRIGPSPLGMVSWKEGKLYLNNMPLGQVQMNFIEDLCYRLFADRL